MSKQTDIKMEKGEIVDAQINLLYNKVIAEFTQDEADTLFLEALKSIMEESVEKRDKNKKAYFSNNGKIGAIPKTISKFGAYKVESILSASNLLAAGTAWVVGASATQTLFKIIVAGAFVLWTSASIWLLGYYEKRRRELLLRRHAQTWVRHSCTISYYKEEMVRFLCHIMPYNQNDEIGKRALFKERCLAITHNNVEQFKHNMEAAKEYIE